MAGHSTPWSPEVSTSGDPLPLTSLKWDVDDQLSARDREAIQARLNWKSPRLPPTQSTPDLTMPLLSAAVQA